MPSLPSEAVERVGGPQDRGPWPEDVAEIVVGETYQRTLPTDEGERTVAALVREIVAIENDAGEPTEGRLIVTEHGGGA